MAVFDVTAHGVSANSTADQSVALKKVFGITADADNAPALAHIYFPASSYYLSEPIMNFAQTNAHLRRWTISGDGPGATVFKVHSSASNIANPIFKVKGEDVAAGNVGSSTMVGWFEMRDLTLDGNSRGVNCNWLEFERAKGVRLDRVEVRNTQGSAIVGTQLWDSCFHDLFFYNCGDDVANKPTIRLQTSYFASDPTGPDQETGYSCNNIKWEACRHQLHNYYALYYDKLTRIIEHLGDTFVAKTGTPPTVPPIRLIGTRGIAFTGGRFTQTNASTPHIRATTGSQDQYTLASSGLLASNNVFEGTAENQYAIVLDATSYSAIVGNFFDVLGGTQYAVQQTNGAGNNQIGHNAINA